jgi:altronate hydrolase
MASISPPAHDVIVARAASDNVGIVTDPVSAGDLLSTDETAITVREEIPSAHKVALRSISEGDPIVKYGQVIGLATSDIAEGSHVHTHNTGLGDLSARGGQNSSTPAAVAALEDVTTFRGYRRPDGRAATRNYIGVIPTVNCSSTVTKLIAQSAARAVGSTPGLDGVVALPHDLGCGMAERTRGDEILRRTLSGYANHVNFAGVLVVSLGCEINQPDNFLDETSTHVAQLCIQDLGGTMAAVNAGVERISAMAAAIAPLRREAIPIAELTLGLQCGGSDAYSGLTANPTLGVAADLLIAAGGRAILGETPEIFGAEHLLRDRAVNNDVAQRLDEVIRWWLEYAASNQASLDNNPSRGNRAGGITTIWEKSLGAVLKGGSSPLNAVVDYAAPVTAPGLTFMDTPGYDPVSATGMVAGGANVMAFTTGRGSLFGSRPTPCLKISSTTDLYTRMRDDIDFDAGAAFGRARQLEDGGKLLRAIVEVASGAPTKSELLGFGLEEIVPWRIGAVL